MYENEVQVPKLDKILKKKINIVLETGLHIGGSKDNFHIGGVDSPVIKGLIKVNDEEGPRFLPYIPGSSLKGKIRSLLEITDKNVKIFNSRNNNEKEKIKIGENYIKYEGESSIIKKIFGVPADDNKENKEFSMTRLIVRDAKPTEETLNLWKKQEDIVEGVVVKGENSINRLTSHANPRFIERVPPGSVFEGELVLLVFEEDKDEEEKMKKKIDEGLRLLEENYLGGSGTRGYGKVKIKVVEDWKPIWPDENNVS